MKVVFAGSGWGLETTDSTNLLQGLWIAVASKRELIQHQLSLLLMTASLPSNPLTAKGYQAKKGGRR